MGRQWVSGLKPAKNVGSNIAEILERLICEVEGKSYVGLASFEAKVQNYKKKKLLKRPVGIDSPIVSTKAVTQYSRDPKVKAWILKEANGCCECCGVKAPFNTPEGEPFLEVHHLKRLADGGSDTVTNAVALCPNCHREFHYGVAKADKLAEIYDKTPRLIQE